MEKACIQVYTGNGKGKTTAAIGQAVRAAGRGLRVCIIQFMKGQAYGEHSSLKSIEKIDIVQAGTEDCIRKEEVEQKHIDAARQGLKIASAKIKSGDYEIVILDEINVAIWFGLIKLSDVMKLLNAKPDNIELILTGRYAAEEIISAADLVTEMKPVKHPYDQGLTARSGIEF
ncbi:MAG: cob(I)yrinic acid a,c-diamide adenosyltransferase [Bacteroidales bacterium]